MNFVGELAAIGNMVLSGIATVIVKSQGEKLKPVVLNLIQTIIAGTSFLIITAASGNFLLMFSISWQALLLLVGAALMGIVIGNLLYFNSLQLIGVSKAYPIAMTYPLLTYVFEVIIFEEVSFKFLKLLGISIVILGIVFISLSKVNNNNGIKKIKEEIISTTKNNDTIIDLEENDSNKNYDSTIEKSKILETNEKESPWYKNSLVLGIILAIFAAVTWAAGTTLIKLGLDRTTLDIITINGARMILLIPFTTIAFFSFPKQRKESKFTWKGILLVILAALISLVGANILYLTSVDLIGTSTPAAIAASGPLIATPLSILLLKEKVDWKIIIGTICTIGGIIFIILLG